MIDGVKYPFIDMWGELLGSQHSYMESEKAKAESLNAPDDTTYLTLAKNKKPQFGTVATCSNLATLYQLEGLAERKKLIQCHRLVQKRIMEVVASRNLNTQTDN